MNQIPTPFKVKSYDTDEYPEHHPSHARLLGSDGLCYGILFGEIESVKKMQQTFVHCVNAHDALVEALRFVMKATADWPGTMSASIDAIREQTQEALALAEGKEPRS